MEKIKPFINNCIESEKGKDFMIVLIVIFIGIGSFFLGRLSKVQNNDIKDIKIEYPTNYQENTSASPIQADLSQIKANIGQNTTQTTIATAKQAGNYFASSRGKKYYTISCSAGKTIKQENRIYFATSTEAEKAGYSLSTSCQ